jgi:hypothetical protein
VGPRAVLDADARGKELRLCLGSKPGRPVRGQSLYRPSYPTGAELFSSNLCAHPVLGGPPSLLHNGYLGASHIYYFLILLY